MNYIIRPGSHQCSNLGMNLNENPTGPQIGFGKNKEILCPGSLASGQIQLLDVAVCACREEEWPDLIGIRIYDLIQLVCLVC